MLHYFKVYIIMLLSYSIMDAIWFFKIEFRGTENIGKSQFILTPNHQSFLDALLLSYAFDDGVMRNTYFIARESLAGNRIIRSLMNKANVILVNFEKDIKFSLIKAASALMAGKNLVIFPEGHRTRDGRIAPFKKTFAILSAETGVAVVPAAIKGAYEALPARKSLQGRGVIQITFCKPVLAPDKNYAAITDKVKGIIEKHL